MLKPVIELVLGALDTFLAPLLAYMKGKTDAENKALEDQVERLADRPRTNGGVVNRLQAWKSKLKNKR